MAKNKNMKSKKIKKLIAVCTLSSLMFVVATYAWFIGMRTVNVAGFEVEIASTDSLLLSLDGSTWDTTVNINSTNYKSVSYENNVNNWADEKGLKPISTIGEIDTTSSTLKMFEKGSLTATPGGYRLMASRIHNYESDMKNAAGYNTENGGYVAFDLFVRNFSGQAYYATNDEKNEEAIYLTTDSAVTVGSTGVADTGIENSVRVGFAQIGRVNGKTTDVDTITGIKCVPGEGSEVTGICRTAQIWEPNDTDHVTDAISYYNTSCRLRPNAEDGSLTDITLSSSYNLNGTCAQVNDGTTYSTYAIGRTISFTDKVDVYDGTTYNGYTGTSRTVLNDPDVNDDVEAPLYAFPYFTDTDKDKAGMDRPTFITLAPNSITKIRVYIWIEGQDVDNYDFSSIGKQIKVNFGFTKERFTENEIQGSDPVMPTGDTIKPVIAIADGKSTVSIAKGGTFDPMDGVTASDKDNSMTQDACTANGGTWTAADGEDPAYCTLDLTTKIQVTNPVTSTSPAGTYIVRYLVSDWQGNYAEATKTVTVTE